MAEERGTGGGVPNLRCGTGGGVPPEGFSGSR